MYILGPTKIRFNIRGWVSLVIYLIVSGCVLGPEAWSKLDHLKLRASKASQQFIQYAFGSHSYVDKYGRFCESWYPSYSLRLLSRSWSSSQLDHLNKHPKPPNNSYSVYLCPTRIGLNMEGCVSLVIYFIVSGCCLGPEAWFQLDHLKCRASKASQQFIQYIFSVPPR